METTFRERLKVFTEEAGTVRCRVHGCTQPHSHPGALRRRQEIQSRCGNCHTQVSFSDLYCRHCGLGFVDTVNVL